MYGWFRGFLLSDSNSAANIETSAQRHRETVLAVLQKQIECRTRARKCGARVRYAGGLREVTLDSKIPIEITGD